VGGGGGRWVVVVVECLGVCIDLVLTLLLLFYC
jgi:hypothetical protein